MAEDRPTDWDRRHRERGYDDRPAAGLLLALPAAFPRSGRALDLAGGTGRNSLWLADRGLDVTLADASAVALEIAEEVAAARGLPIRTFQADLEAGPIPAGPWDVLLCVDFLWRPLYRAFAGALAPGGWLVVSHPTETNLERHPRPGPRHLLRLGELPGLAAGGLEVVRFDEGRRESGRHEAWLVARAPGPAGVDSRGVPG